MRLFDFSLLVGSDPFSPAEATQEALVEYLDREDAGGIVTSLAGLYYDYLEGNRETLEVSRSDERLLAGLTVDPRRPDSAHVDFARAAKDFRALVLFQSFQPGIPQSWPLTHPALPGLFEKASRAGLPVVVHVGRGGDVQAICKLALGVDVPVIALGLSYAAINEVIAGAAAAGNLLFGMSVFGGLDNLETLVSRLGPERFVYNSGESRFSHGPALAVLESAQIDEGAREIIAVGNGRRILGGAL